MKPTKTFLTLLITAQFAMVSQAYAVDTKTTTATSAGVTTTTTTTTAAKKTAAKPTAKTKKAKMAATAQKNKKTTKTKSSAATTGKPVQKITETAVVEKSKAAEIVEPKPAIETEVESIESMEAAAVAANTAKTKSNKQTSTTTAVSLAPTSGTSVMTKPAAAETKFLTYNLSLGVTYNQSAEAPKEGDLPKYNQYDIVPTFTLGPIRTLVWFEYQHDLVKDENSEWQDFPIIFTLVKPYNAGDYITLSPGLSFTVPQTKATKNDAQLNYAANVNTIIGLNTKTLGWDGVVLNFQTGYTKMNNEFTTTSKGEPTTSYRFRQRINFWYPITGSLTLKTRAQFDSNFSYENVVRNNFLHFEVLEYGFLEKYNVNIGHTNAGPVLNPAYEGNMKFYSSESSEYFLGLGADF